MVGLLVTFVKRASSFPQNNGGRGSGSTIPRSALMHLAGAGRVNLLNNSTCLHRLARVVALSVHPGNWDDNGQITAAAAAAPLQRAP